MTRPWLIQIQHPPCADLDMTWRMTFQPRSLYVSTRNDPVRVCVSQLQTVSRMKSPTLLTTIALLLALTVWHRLVQYAIRHAEPKPMYSQASHRTRASCASNSIDIQIQNRVISKVNRDDWWSKNMYQIETNRMVMNAVYTVKATTLA